MSELECWLLAVALAMDCFTVSMTCGFVQKKIDKKQIFIMAVLFGGFQAIMPIIGWIATTLFSEYISAVDHWFAFGLLILLGGKMIWEGLKPRTEQKFCPCKITTILTLAVATSIDALAIGVSFTCLGMNNFNDIIYPISIIGFVSFAATIIGKAIGATIGKRVEWRTELLGGLILILIGFKVLFNA